MIPTIPNSCVLLRPHPVAAESRGSRGRREKREEGGVHEEIARPDGGWIIDLASNNTNKMSIVPIGNLEDLMFTCVRQ
jgi:hypothetical protein